MGKLADLIQRATRSAPAPLGFGSVRASAAPSMLVVAVAAARWQDAAADAVSSAASAIIFTENPSESDLKKAVAAAGDCPCGLLSSDAQQLAAAKEAGADFAILSGDAPASVLQDDGLTFLLATPLELTDMQLRTIEPLPVDALYLPISSAPLTISRQMELQRVSGLARKPLLVFPAADANHEDLMSLREAGVVLLGVDMQASAAKKTLGQLTELVAALPPRRTRQRGEKAEVTLPTPAHGHEEFDEEDEE